MPGNQHLLDARLANRMFVSCPQMIWWERGRRNWLSQCQRLAWKLKCRNVVLQMLENWMVWKVHVSRKIFFSFPSFPSPTIFLRSFIVHHFILHVTLQLLCPEKELSRSFASPKLGDYFSRNDYFVDWRLWACSAHFFSSCTVSAYILPFPFFYCLSIVPPSATWDDNIYLLYSLVVRIKTRQYMWSALKVLHKYFVLFWDRSSVQQKGWLMHD